MRSTNRGIKGGTLLFFAGLEPPSLSAYDRQQSPYAGNPDYPDDQRDFNWYIDYMHDQVEELCTTTGR